MTIFDFKRLWCLGHVQYANDTHNSSLSISLYRLHTQLIVELPMPELASMLSAIFACIRWQTFPAKAFKGHRSSMQLPRPPRIYHERLESQSTDQIATSTTLRPPRHLQPIRQTNHGTWQSGTASFMVSALPGTMFETSAGTARTLEANTGPTRPWTASAISLE